MARIQQSNSQHKDSNNENYTASATRDSQFTRILISNDIYSDCTWYCWSSNGVRTFNHARYDSGDMLMKTPQEKAVELLPFVQALANGEDVLESGYPATGTFIHGIVFSIKPKTMLVNGFEVPEPMRLAPRYRSKCYSPGVNNDNFVLEDHWIGDDLCHRRLSRGLIHSTKEAAIAHAKAMLNIDPNGGE